VGLEGVLEGGRRRQSGTGAGAAEVPEREELHGADAEADRECARHPNHATSIEALERGECGEVDADRGERQPDRLWMSPEGDEGERGSGKRAPSHRPSLAHHVDPEHQQGQPCDSDHPRRMDEVEDRESAP
jgi:hypothetical protein